MVENEVHEDFKGSNIQCPAVGSTRAGSRPHVEIMLKKAF